MYKRKVAVIMAFLLWVIADTQALGQTLDVCATCHTNATCDDKTDGSGKVCNCMYGFVGNGRTFCQDKDECQIGSHRICGQHTTCHNTFGSYYCTCLAGYTPSNNMATFIPNDGTHCQDIDECRVPGICGEGTQCRNLEGSFNCHCQVGYQVQNGAEPFHPHKDKASCKVVDCGHPPSLEDTVLLSATGTRYGNVATFGCDHGFLWMRGDNSAVCEADGAWKGPTLVCEEVNCGPPPALPHSHMLWNQTARMGSQVVYLCNSGYHNVGEGNVSMCTSSGTWDEAYVLCQEMFCRDPPVIEHTERVWNGNSTPGSTVFFHCKEGFYNKGGDNVSHCTEKGHWTQPSFSCQEIFCGDPPILPHVGQVWNGNSTPGTTVLFYCKIGFYYDGGNNISLCTINGHWTKPNVSCKEVDCGAPPVLPHSAILWNNGSKMGSRVAYQCNSGYRNVGKGNVMVCMANGIWNEASLLCEEIKCGEPISKSNSKILWNKASHIGSVVYYQCAEGYYSLNVRNDSLCQENGLWEDIDLQCEEISCGPPLTLPHTAVLWDNSTRPGSVVVYVCVDGYYQESGHSVSKCSISGQWGSVSLKCKAKCGPVPALANSEVMWHNMSMAIHQCLGGHHSWRGSNVSVCGITGTWQVATLRCIEVKPAINDLIVFNEKCLRWKAEKYEEDVEDYRVIYVGSRDYQRSFHDKRKRFLRSKSNQLELCLNLLPVTNYTIAVSAVSARFTATVTANTSLQVPRAPVISYREVETPLPTLRLRRSTNTLDPISFYQVFVLPVEGTMVFDCTSPRNPDFNHRKSHGLYITAQVLLRQVGTEINFTVGDGHHYGGFYNAPLQNGRDYYIIVRAVTQWEKGKLIENTCPFSVTPCFTQDCTSVLKDSSGNICTSYILRVSSLSAGGSIGLVTLVILGGYSYTWFCKKT